MRTTERDEVESVRFLERLQAVWHGAWLSSLGPTARSSRYDRDERGTRHTATSWMGHPGTWSGCEESKVTEQRAGTRNGDGRVW